MAAAEYPSDTIDTRDNTDIIDTRDTTDDLHPVPFRRVLKCPFLSLVQNHISFPYNLSGLS